MTTTPSSTTKPTIKSLSYLTLGDGDFTYSLDLCRYIQHSSPLLDSSSLDNNHRVNVTCTGIDSYSQLKSKYRDVDSILRQIRLQKGDDDDDDEKEGQERKRSKKNNDWLSVSIQHGVNAILPPLTTSKATQTNNIPKEEEEGENQQPPCTPPQK
eukprot:15006728-Ditylum_brightwellii.AAC.1